MYHFKNHKSNYLVIIGDTETPNVVGLTVKFDKNLLNKWAKQR